MYMDDNARHYLNEIKDYYVPTKEEEYELFSRLLNGDDSVKEEILKCYLKFVVKVACQFMHQGMPLSDLIQEGNIGLMDVIEKYDPSLGYRFTTYAAFWIRQSIQRALKKKSRMIRIPIRKSRMMGKLNEEISNFWQTQGREPVPGELAKALDISEKDVRSLMELRESVLSYDSAIGDDDSHRLLQYLADENTASPYEVSYTDQRRVKIDEVLDQLNEREREVLTYRFGLDDHDELSLRKISKKMGLSQEGVRRIQNRALDKLRRPATMSFVAGLV